MAVSVWLRPSSTASAVTTHPSPRHRRIAPAARRGVPCPRRPSSEDIDEAVVVCQFEHSRYSSPLLSCRRDSDSPAPDVERGATFECRRRYRRWCSSYTSSLQGRRGKGGGGDDDEENGAKVEGTGSGL
ncbi:hypothetical protein EJB05_00314, partial [Eragrostis curvula]